MKVRVDGSKILAIIVFFFLTTFSFGQVIRSGEIVFEKRTNLEKRYEGTEVRGGRNNDWMKKPKIDEFVLYFDDSTSVFQPTIPEIGDEDREWATMKNSTYQNFNSNLLEREFSFYGSKVYLRDSIKNREWIITETVRDIAGFKTKQALWIANDSTKIYAWYSEQILPSVGPESFNGLPGAILGLALEDGGVVYFAKEVKELSKKDIKKQMPKGKEKDYFTNEGLKNYVLELFSSREGTGGRVLDDIFVW